MFVYLLIINRSPTIIDEVHQKDPSSIFQTFTKHLRPVRGQQLKQPRW